MDGLRQKEPARIRISPNTQSDKSLSLPSPTGDSSTKAAKSQPATAGRRPLRVRASPPRLAMDQCTLAAPEGHAKPALSKSGIRKIDEVKIKDR